MLFIQSDWTRATLQRQICWNLQKKKACSCNCSKSWFYKVLAQGCWIQMHTTHEAWRVGRNLAQYFPLLLFTLNTAFTLPGGSESTFICVCFDKVRCWKRQQKVNCNTHTHTHINTMTHTEFTPLLGGWTQTGSVWKRWHRMVAVRQQ